jgi:peptidyl-prolyl cis-trans isomerase SurA
MKIPRWIVSAVLLACAVFTARAQMINGIRAIVHDSVITVEEVYARAAQAEALLRRQYRSDADAFRQKRNQLLEENLDQLVQRQLVLRDFAEAGYNLPESIVDEAVNDRLREQFGGDRVKFMKTLQAEGTTFEKYREVVREQIIVEILRSKNVSQAVVISPHKIEQYYRDNGEKYKVEDQVKLRMIVLNKGGSTETAQAQKLAEEILVKVKEGASFTEMATIHSQGSQRAQGGDWGWVEKAVLKKELADVAFGLKAGETSGIIDQPEACYLMSVEEHRPAHIRPLNEVRDEIERTLMLEQRARLQKRYVDRLKAKTFVRYF